jgi:hypothetical protein
MAYKKGYLGAVVAGLCFVLSLLPQQETARARPEKPPRETGPLIRKDLLNFGEATPPPTLRNIFRPVPSARRSPVPRKPAVSRKVAEGPSGDDQQPSFSLTLNYVGSVQAGGRTMALVVWSGEAVPVAEGEEIAPGYRVIRINPLEIEVEGPGGERKVFSRQGDR